MHRSLNVLAVMLSASVAPVAGASVLTYQFNGTLTNNTMISGGFAGASLGAPVSLQITVETSTTPGFSNANQNFWDGVSGTILDMKASVGGFLSQPNPNPAPTRARVVNDALAGGGPNHYDQFWMEVPALAPSPDFVYGAVILSRNEPGPAVASSLTGIDWPATNAELDIATFTLEHYILFRGATGPEFLRADITQVFVAPTPGAIAPLALGLFLFTPGRRR